MSDHINNLLVVLAEECAEVVQAICKIQAFGMDSRHPETGVPNDASLQQEIADVLTVVDMLHDADFLSWSKIEERKELKLERMKRYRPELFS